MVVLTVRRGEEMTVGLTLAISAEMRILVAAKMRICRSLWVLLILCSPAVASADSTLIEAAKAQNKQYVQQLIGRKAPVNEKSADGTSALHWAAYWDDSEMANLLLRAGAHVNVANDLGVTPLFLASGNGNAPLVQRLLAAGAKPDDAHTSGVTPLMQAARVGSAATVKALLVGGADVNARETAHTQTALMWAVAHQHASVAQVLIEHGADLTARSKTRRQLVNRVHQESTQSAGSTEWIDAGGYTALLFAAVRGSLPSARLLLAAGAGANDTAPDGSSAIGLAAFSGHGAVARLLLDHGADPNAAGTGYSPLHAAVLRGDGELVKELLARGANPNAQLTNGTAVRRYGWNFIFSQRLVSATPYVLAAKYLEPEIMRLLASHGAETRLAMADGTTALMAAAGIGGDGRTGSFNRRDQRFSDDNVQIRDDPDRAAGTVRAALASGADVNAINRVGDTALHGAAARGLGAVIELLVEHGAELDARNKRGLTPLAMTRRVGFSEGGGEVSDDSLERAAALLRKLGAQQ